MHFHVMEYLRKVKKSERIDFHAFFKSKNKVLGSMFRKFNTNVGELLLDISESKLSSSELC